mgnify:FL=1
MQSGIHDLAREVFGLYAQEQYGRALNLVEQSMAALPHHRSRMTFWAACLECRLQRPADALQRLQALVAKGGWLNPDRLQSDDDLLALRDAPGWNELVAICEQRRADEQTQHVPEVQIELAENSGNDPSPLIVALHMAGGSAEEIRSHWLPVTGMGYSLAIPQGDVLLGPGEYSWSDQPAGLIGRHISRLSRTHKLDSERIVLGGASRGAGHAVELALSGQPFKAKGFIAVAGAPRIEVVRPLVDIAKGAGVRGVLIAGDRDPVLPRVRDVHQLLEASGIDVRLQVVPGLGHEYPANFADLLRPAVEFISTGTETKSRIK